MLVLIFFIDLDNDTEVLHAASFRGSNLDDISEKTELTPF